ncbi:MAG: right-handed parallel beta-helix repeat-containing protein [Chloroflexota bacterium]
MLNLKASRACLAVCLLLLLAAALGCTKWKIGGSAGVPERVGTGLSDMVDAAPSGGTVEVPAGHYHEQVEITKPLTLKAAGDGDVIIDGDCERNSGISIPYGSNITISGIQIRNTIGAGVLIGNGPDGEAPPEHITVDKTRITDFDCQKGDVQFQAGIAVWNAGCCMTLTDNMITYRTDGDGHGRGNGIWFKSNTAKPSGGHHVISGNVIRGGWDGIGGENEDDAHGTFDGNTTVENNKVSGCWDDGIQVEGGDTNVIVRYNEIEKCGTGIAFAAAVTGPLFVEHNYIHDLEVGLYDNQFCFKIGNVGDGVVNLKDNICWTDGDGLLQTNAEISPIVSTGNCYKVSRYVMETDGELPAGSSFFGDVFWTTDPDRFIKWGETRFDDVISFRNATGFEAKAFVTEDCPWTPGEVASRE